MMRVDAWYLAVAPCDMRLGMDEAQRKLFVQGNAKQHRPDCGVGLLGACAAQIL